MQSQRLEMEALKNESRVIKAERASMQERLQALNLQLARGKSNGHTHTTLCETRIPHFPSFFMLL